MIHQHIGNLHHFFSRVTHETAIFFLFSSGTIGQVPFLTPLVKRFGLFLHTMLNTRQIDIGLLF